MNSFKQRHAVWQKVTLKSFLLPLFVFGILSAALTLLAVTPERAAAATADTLNFQGRLMTSGGATVPDGSYNIEFKIYDSVNLGASAPTVCSLNSSTDDCWWIETQSVTVQNGYYSVYLGDVTPFGANIPWDQELWLTMNVSSDGEMTPRFKLTAVPYAFRAGALVTAGGVAKTADDFAQLSPSAVQTINTAIAALRLNQTGTGALLQLQGNGTDVFTVDKAGNAVLGAGITIGNSSSTVAGTIRWNGSTFQGYNGSTWASLGSSAVMPFVSKTKLVDELQDNGVNPTATLQADNELFFSIGANETWNYRFLLQVTMNATPDIKFSVTAPVGAVCSNGVRDSENAISVGNLACGVSSGNIAGVTATDVYEVSGSVTNGANAGVVTLNWAQNTANAADTIVRAGSYVEASRSVGGSSADVAFIQNGNTFGGLAVLGTNDANGLAFETNGVERMQILSSGEIRAQDDLIANRVTTGVTGTTTGTGSNTTTLTLVADSFNVNDVVFVDNVGQDYYTRITVDPGTGSYTISPAITFETGRTVTGYTVQNIGATTTDYSTQANRFFQGYFLGGVVVGAGSTTIADGSIESTTTLRIQQGGGDVQIGGGLTVTGTLSGDASGLTNVSGAAVDGATITALDASNISSGTLADARLSTNVTLLGNTFNGNSQLVQLDASGNLPVLNGAALTNISSASLTGALPAISGASLTSLNGSNISSGTVADARLSSSVTLLGNTFNGINQLVQLDGSGNLPALNGAALTSLSSANLTGALPAISGASLISLNGSNISSGTVADARLSANVTLLGNTFNGVSQLVQLDASGNLPILNGAALTNISSANLTGSLPAISGASLTSLNASNISSGTVADARLSSNVTVLGNTFNGINQLVQLNGTGLLPALNGSNLTNISGANITGALPAISGASLTSLNGSNISSGTVADARLSANVTLLGNTFNGVSQLVRLDGSGNLPAINGAALTNLSAANLTGALPAISGASLTSLNGSNISSGTVADARLSSNVTVLGNTFNGINQLVRLGGTGALPALNASALTSLTSANLTGALPAISGASLTNLTAANLTGALPAISGASLTSLNGSNISSGTLADARLSSNVTVLGNTFNGINQLVQLNGTGLLPALNGSNLTNISGANITGALPAISGVALTSLNASNISSGTVADGRLSANVALLTGTQTFTGAKSFSAGLTVSGGDIAQTGNISATGSITGATIVGDGSALTALNGSNISSGTVADGRLSTNVALLTGTQTFTGAKSFSAGLTVSGGTISQTGDISATGQVAGATIVGNGSGVTALSATNVSSGTLADGRLSANVALLTGTQTFTGTKTFTSAGLVLGQSTFSSAATVARAVSFPDEAGTVCLSNTNTCGFLRLAAGAVQTDATNNDVLAVNKTSATGNLITLQRSGTAVFTVANSGALQIQATGTAALDIRNVGGTSYFSVDTNTGVVRVGPAAADATGVLFVLDTKNTAGDPTGQNGAQYYNSALQQFRCYRDGAWEACGSNPIDRTWAIEDEFMSGYTGGACNTTTAIVGNLNWACYAGGTATTAYNVGAILPSADHPGIMRMTTAAANGNGFTIAATGNNSGSLVLAANQRVQSTVGQGATITNNRLRVGLHAQTTTNVRPTTGVWWEADATTNANWNYCFGTGAAATCASSGVPIVASTLYSLDIRINAVGAGVSSATFVINGTSFNVTGVTIGTATRVNPAISCFNSAAGARECFVDYYRASGTAAARR